MVKESMTRSSPGVRRVAAILNFMADHPGQAFVLTDLVRSLKLSRATCHALLTGLVEVGYLYRTNDKSYVLGPALAAIGRTAASHFSPLQVAQTELRRLADGRDLIASAYVLEGDSVVVRGRAAAASHVGYLGPVGTRLKLRPRTAAVFMAWTPEKKVAAWLESHDPPFSEEQRQDLFRGMALAREQGFIAILRTVTAGQEAGPVFGMDVADASVTVAHEIKPGEPYSLAALVTPVFDDQGRVVIAIGLAGFGPPIPGAEVLAIADELKAASERITRFITGERPAQMLEPELVT